MPTPAPNFHTALRLGAFSLYFRLPPSFWFPCLQNLPSLCPRPLSGRPQGMMQCILFATQTTHTHTVCEPPCTHGFPAHRRTRAGIPLTADCSVACNTGTSIATCVPALRFGLPVSRLCDALTECARDLRRYASLLKVVPASSVAKGKGMGKVSQAIPRVHMEEGWFASQ